MTSLLEAAGIRPFVILADAGKGTVELQPDIASWPPMSLTLVRSGSENLAHFFPQQICKSHSLSRRGASTSAATFRATSAAPRAATTTRACGRRPPAPHRSVGHVLVVVDF